MNTRWSLFKKYPYPIMIGLLALAGLVHWGLWYQLDNDYFFILDYSLVIVLAILGGFYAGMLAITGFLLLYVLPLIKGDALLDAPFDRLPLLFLMMNTGLIFCFSESIYRLYRRLKVEYNRLEFILNTSKQGYCDLNLDTKTSVRSALHDQIFGYSSPVPEWTHDSFLKHVHPEDMPVVEHAFKAAMMHQKPWEFQCRIYRADDKQVRWISAVGELLQEGPSTHMLGVVQDITQRKNLELALAQMTAKFNTLLEATPDALVIIDQKGHIIFSNKLIEKLFGYTTDELMEHPIEILIPPRYTQKHITHRNNYMKNPQMRLIGVGVDLFGRHKEGHEFPVEVSLNPLSTAEGLCVLAAIRDISERKRNEATKAMLSALVEFSDEAIIGCDLEGLIFGWNHGAELLYGYPMSAIIGRHVRLLVPDEKQADIEAILTEAAQGGHTQQSEILGLHQDGHVIPLVMTGAPIQNPNKEVVGIVITLHDMTQQKLVEEKLKHIAEHDPLTGLVTRLIFEDRLNQAIAFAQRNETHVAVLFIDIDNFKKINDNYGHAVGDLLIRAVAKRIQKCVRKIDTLARFGGDEFALILTNLKDGDKALLISKKINSSCSKALLKKNIKVTLSIGIVIYPQEDKNLIEKADMAMYEVKKSGKNNIKIYKKHASSPSKTAVTDIEK